MMTYKNHIFTIHNVESGNTFQVEGKGAFIEWLNKYSTNRNSRNFKYFTTYNNFKQWEKKYG